MAMDTESIAITGMSGRFPKCPNIAEFQEALYAGRDLVSDNHNRWSYEALDTSPRLGIIDGFEYFDAAFFGINPKEANVNDPRLRKILEVTYEAVVDAGLNPAELRGTKVGVFLGISPNDISDLSYKGGILGRSAAIMANIVSYCFDFKGPSLAVNTACSSALFAFNHAVESIVCGRCSTAIVGAVQHQVDPAESIELLNFGVLHREGICKPFDANRKGYVKSEAIAAIVLQKVENSRRIYATIAGVGTNVEGFKREGMAHPSHEMQYAMFKDVHGQFSIDPLEVCYVEAHCTGTIVGDVEEVEAIDDFYTKGRKTPLLLGSVKSNLGHTETTSGIVSLIKAIFAIREGIIPGNLHFKTPDPAMKGICEGRIKVIDKNMPLPKGLIAVNSFGFGGANAMVILRPYTQKKQISNELTHRLVHVSGRTEESLQLMLEEVIKNKHDSQFLSLFDSIYNRPIDNHNHRGYAVLSKESHYHINQCSSKRRPVWYVYAGFGSQWPSMGKDMMQIELFRNTIKKCADVLNPLGIDLEAILMKSTDEMLNDVSKTFSAITAISIALTDVLSAMNIRPDGIIGHSLGEVACAYADGAITAEQAVLISYARGYAASSSKLIPGAMVAVGLSNDDCAKILPEGIYIACENADDNVTIAGPREAISNFVKQLNARGVFNRIISNANYALHCPHLMPAGQKMYEIAKKALPDRQLRTKRWLSTSFHESEWNTEMAKYNSAEYQFHNYLNKVHFNQVLKYIPKDAIVIEVAPKGLFQGILKRVVDPNVALISLMKPDSDNINFFFSSIGKFYNSGGQLDLRKFYKSGDFPVSINTPMISSLVKWDHRIKWYGLKYNAASSFGSRVDIDMNEKENEYLEGHVADGRVILPAAGYIFLVWESFAKMLETTYTKLPVVFENVKTLRPILLHKNETTTIVINIFRSSGYFEIFLENDEQNLLSSGKISVAEEIEKEYLDYPIPFRSHQSKLKISRDEFYNNMRLRGFVYSGIFTGVQQCDLDGKSAILKWNNNWVAFIDSIVQFVLSIEATGHSLPTIFDKIVINPTEHLKSVGPNSNMLLQYDKDLKAAKCGGVEVRNIVVTNVKIRSAVVPPTLRKYTFVPNNENEKDDFFQHSVNVATQIVVENCLKDLNIHIGEIGSDSATQIIKSLTDRENLKRMTFTQIKSNDDRKNPFLNFLICTEESTVKTVEDYMDRADFVFAKLQNVEIKEADIIYTNLTKSGTYVLLKRHNPLPEDYTVVIANNNSYSWVKDLKVAVKKYRSSKSRIYLINEDFNSGIIGLFNTVRLEQYCANLRVFLIRSYDKIETFSFKSDFYLDQLRKDLTVNIYQDGSWGTYRRLPLTPFQPNLISDACLLKDNRNIKWVQKSPYINHNNILVHIASISKWDYLIANDKAGLDAEKDYLLGLEYSGIDKNGNNVMGVLPEGALATTVKAHPKLTWNFSNKLSFQEAATIPLAYTLSYYSLFVRTHLTSKDSILVHNCTSDLSMAAINLTLNKGCIVYVNCDASEADLLINLFPKLDERNIILFSKKNELYKTIMKKTKGKGVGTIFNCNSMDLLKLSKKCISKNGRFIEVANSVIQYLLADDIIEKNCSFDNVNVADVFEENDDTLSTIASDIDRYLKDGTIIPLKYSIFDKDNIEGALKHLEDNQIGKCLIKIRETRKFFSKPEARVLAYPRTYVHPQKSFIIIGGLGGFGFQLAKWLIERGATTIVLNSRFDIRSGYQASCLQKWNNDGLIVVTNTSDSSNIEGAESLINFATNLAPVGGIFNTALHVQDEFMSEVTPADFMAVAPGKIFSAQNMDILSRKMCKHLDYFVMFSSIASSIGNPIQGNYAFVNSAVERLCETRKAEGLPGLTIEWGPLADVGILVRLKLSVEYLETQRQKLSSLLEVLDQFLQQEEPVVSSCVYGNEEDKVSEKKTLVEMVAILFGIKDVNDIEDSKTLLELGMDSLLGFEVKHILSKETGAEVNINDIRNMTFEQIRNISA